MRGVILLIGLFIFSFSLPLSCDRGDTGKTPERPKHNADTNATKVKELYELSERCGKTSAQRFKEEVGKEGLYSDKAASGGRTYNSHYNVKLNKCFILTTDQSYGPTRGLVKLLFDINENKEYGEIVAVQINKDSFETTVSNCYVLETHCKSEKEWDLLVKPYMEE
jgi:hypothetical protein